jgi:hypothetical protein
MSGPSPVNPTTITSPDGAASLIGSAFIAASTKPVQQGPGEAGDARCKSDLSKYRDPAQLAPHTIPAQRPPQRSGIAHARSNAADVPGAVSTEI